MTTRNDRVAAVLAEFGEDVTTADKIAKACGFSVRTVYRHIKALQADGHRIESAVGLGYMLRPRREAGHV